MGHSFDTTAPYFPGFPLVARYVGALLGSTLAGGIIANHLASIAGAFVLTRLVRRLRVGLEDGHAVAREASLFWMASPLTFFFCVFLSESLFSLWSVLVMWAVVAGVWPVALLAGVFACATRNAGMLVWGSAILLAWERRQTHKLTLTAWCCLGLMPAGLVAVMLWQWSALDNPFAWVETQARWGRDFVAPWRTLHDDWLGFPGLLRRNVDKMYRTQEVLALLLAAPLLGLRRHLQLPWGLWVLGITEWLLPLTTHSLISSARYQSANIYFALAFPILLVRYPTMRGLCWMLFGMVLAWYASTFPFGVWAS